MAEILIPAGGLILIWLFVRWVDKVQQNLRKEKLEKYRAKKASDRSRPVPKIEIPEGEEDNQEFTELPSLDFYVAGVHIPKRKDIVRYSLQFGDTVYLKREPNNPYNSEAIAVHTDYGHIGYVPEIELSNIHSILDRIELSVVDDLGNADDYVEVGVQVYYNP